MWQLFTAIFQIKVNRGILCLFFTSFDVYFNLFNKPFSCRSESSNYELGRIIQILKNPKQTDRNSCHSLKTADHRYVRLEKCWTATVTQ